MENEIKNNEVVNNEEENSVGIAKTQNEETKAIDYEELIKTDKKLQSFVDRKITSANKTALQNAREKWELEKNENISEAQKLQQMTKEQQLEYKITKLEKQNKELSNKIQTNELKNSAMKIATDPATAFNPKFLELFDFDKLSSDELNKKIEFARNLQNSIKENAINEWTKEKSPYNPINDNTNKTALENRLDSIMGIK